MRARTYQRLAMAQAALMVPDLIVSVRGSLEKVPKLIDGQMRAELETVRLERAKALTPAKKLNVGRNEACPCGSGKKFKRCCIRKG